MLKHKITSFQHICWQYILITSVYQLYLCKPKNIIVQHHNISTNKQKEKNRKLSEPMHDNIEKINFGVL